MADFWRDLIWAAVRDPTNALSVVMPGVLAMLALVGLGAVRGWIGGALVRRLAHAGDLDRRSREWGLTHALARAGVYRTPSELLRLVVFWGVFVIFATMGIDALAIPGAPGATGMLMYLLPRALSALLILVVGWLAANFLGQAVLIAAVNASLPEARLLARAARWLVVRFAFAAALTEIGIGPGMVLVAFGSLFGGLVLAPAPAVGLGGRYPARPIPGRGRVS